MKRDNFKGALEWFRGLIAALFGREHDVDIDVGGGWLETANATGARLLCFEKLVVRGCAVP